MKKRGEKPKSEREKKTFYFDPENLTALETERLRRIQQGTPRREADLSDILNDLIRRSLGQQATAVKHAFTAHDQAQALRSGRGK